MSRINDIWEAYYRGQSDAENEDIGESAVHNTAGHMLAATFAIFGESDEEIAYEKGYHGEDLEICEECERIEDNCECDD